MTPGSQGVCGRRAAEAAAGGPEAGGPGADHGASKTGGRKARWRGEQPES